MSQPYLNNHKEEEFQSLNNHITEEILSDLEYINPREVCVSYLSPVPQILVAILYFLWGECIQPNVEFYSA